MIAITNATNQFYISDRPIKLGKERHVYFINAYFHFIAILISNVAFDCEITFTWLFAA